jgi:hypothetical protein
MSESALDTVGILYGTNKSSLEVDFLRHYERELAQFRDQAINVVEIGVAGGASLLTWQRFFSVATIVGIDINPNCKRLQVGRAIIEIGSQADPDFLDEVCRKYPPTIVIDDGSHKADHIRFTFEHIFPLLAPGGCYIIEDLHFHFNPPTAEAWRGTATMAPQEYLGELATRVLAAEFGTNLKGALGSGFAAAIDRIGFLPRAAIIWKKSEADFAARIDRWENLAKQANSSYNWNRLARIILKNAGPLDRAETAARAAIELEKRTWDRHHTLAQILELKGDLPGACQAEQAAIDAITGDPAMQTRLAAHLERLKAKLATSVQS